MVMRVTCCWQQGSRFTAYAVPVPASSRLSTLQQTVAAWMCASLSWQQALTSMHFSVNEFTPLHVASIVDRHEVCEVLVAAGAVVDATAAGAFKPLHIASHHGCRNVCISLLAAGAAVNATPVHPTSGDTQEWHCPSKHFPTD